MVKSHISPQQQAFAEIIESSLHVWRAQCWQWDNFPCFGSLVTITTPERILFGIVHQIQTGSLDPHRTPFPYQKTEDELMREQPQIFAFLQTTFTCLTVGFEENNTLLYQWAPQPPKIHAFVTPATQQNYEKFFASDHYIHLLFNISSAIMNLDELFLAILRLRAEKNLLQPAQLAHFVETFSLLTGNDYRRLKLFLQRIIPAIAIAK